MRLALICSLALFGFQDPEERKIQELMEQLGSSDIEIRESASLKLMEIGDPAIPFLKEASKSSDPEISLRAKEILVGMKIAKRRITLKKGMSEGLLREFPEILDRVTLKSTSLWLSLLKEVVGCAYGKGIMDSGIVVVAGGRKYLETTRRDFVALLDYYASGSWRDDRVEGLLYGISDYHSISLPDHLVKMKEAFRAAGKTIPSTGGRYGGRIGGRNRQPIRDLMDRKEETWSDVAKKALHGNRQDSISALVLLLRYKKDVTVRTEAIMRLSSLEAEGIWKPLAVCLDDPEPAVQAKAAHALGKLDCDPAEQELIRKSTVDDVVFRRAVFSALSSWGLPDSVPTFEKGLKDPDGGVRRFALVGLGLAKAADRAKDVVPLLKDPDLAIRIKAIRTLGDLGNPSVKGDIRPFLRKIHAREDAIQALGRLGDETMIEMLIPRLDDIQPSVCITAAIALARLNAKELLPQLRDLWDRRFQYSPVLLWELNRFSHPEAWSKISKKILSQRKYRGSTEEVLRIWKTELGIGFEDALGSRDKRRSQKIRLGPGASIEEALFALRLRGFNTYILDSEGTIRIRTVNSASRYWKSWLKDHSED